MVAVAADHVQNVRDRPLREDFAVTEVVGHTGIPSGHPFVFRRGKFVERLVHHEQAHAIAQIQKLRVRGIVAGANRIDADFLQQTQTPFQHLVRHRRAE